VTIGAQRVSQLAALSDWKSWTTSHFNAQCRPVITTDRLSLLRPT
jgi:hypothetical protein